MTDWGCLAGRADNLVGTPCYVIAEDCIADAIGRLQNLQSSVPLRHWLSLKTQPVSRLIQLALSRGLGVDVVSEYELRAAIGEGVPAHMILINGVGKRRWLADCRVRNLTVHFDSIAEVRELATRARTLDWRVGLRCAIPEVAPADTDCDIPEWNQFGMTGTEMKEAASMLARAGVAVSGLHFHLRTSVPVVGEYRRALSWLADVAELAGIRPAYVDVGGGLPVAGETSLDGVSAASTFDLVEFRSWLASIPRAFPSINEVWLENGRFLSAASAALVVTVLDRKVRGEETYLICDGGRVNHARMASFERHELVVLPERDGRCRKTTICGPTCGAIDRLGSWMLPESVAPGDRLIWLNAGAYHIPLETRFSTGLAPVVWFDHGQVPAVVRYRETAGEWWGHWLQPEGHQYPSAEIIPLRSGGRFP
jgi:diaminopimelate decarboxylase